MKKIIRIIATAIVAVQLLVGMTACIEHEHDYEKATCTVPKTCKCGATKGEALGHSFSNASCTEPSVCERCGETVEPEGHDFTELVCATPQTCKKCGAMGDRAEHNFSVATCTTPSICSRCGLVGGAELGHNYANATCTSPQICRRCNATNGSALGHNYKEATCTEPQKCTRCGGTNGSELGHSYNNGNCIRCGKVDPNTLPTALEDVHLISSDTYKTESFTDSFGNTYTLGHRYGLSFSLGGESSHNLSKNYKIFNCSFVCGGDQNKDDIDISIYADGKLVWSTSEFDKLSGKLDVEIDVTNVKVLTIKTRWARSLYLVNGQLWK